MQLTKLAADNALTKEVYNRLAEDYPKETLAWVKNAKWEKKSIPLSEINMSRRPGGRNMSKVHKMAKAVEEGEDLGPVVLIKQSDGSYQVGDGYHRTLAYKHAKKDAIEAYVGDTGSDRGPWDKEMHAKKLNVEPGKTASLQNIFDALLAESIEKSGLAKMAGAYEKLSREELLSRVSKKQDKDGWYVYTHRARSNSYPTIDDIPLQELRNTERTG